MLSRLKHGTIRTLEALGLRRFALRRTRHRLRILCYHGFSIENEHRFRPKLFITAPTFRKRLTQLRDDGFAVLPLGEALERLWDGSLPERAATITIDDGFYNVRAVGAPVLREFGFPYTVYLTSYYSEVREPIFRLAVQFMQWRSGRLPDLERLGVAAPDGDYALRDETRMNGWVGAVVARGENELDEPGRQELLERLAKELEFDLAELVRSRVLHLLEEDEIRELAREGADFQLHTHTHRFPHDEETLRREVERNREYVRSAAGRDPVHLCYPSGLYDETLFGALERAGVRSGATCHAGLADRSAPPFLLPRILDGESLAHQDFCSELSGVKSLLRSIRPGAG